MTSMFNCTDQYRYRCCYTYSQACFGKAQPTCDPSLVLDDESVRYFPRMNYYCRILKIFPIDLTGSIIDYLLCSSISINMFNQYLMLTTAPCIFPSQIHTPDVSSPACIHLDPKHTRRDTLQYLDICPCPPSHSPTSTTARRASLHELEPARALHRV